MKYIRPTIILIFCILIITVLAGIIVWLKKYLGILGDKVPDFLFITIFCAVMGGAYGVASQICMNEIRRLHDKNNESNNIYKFYIDSSVYLSNYKKLSTYPGKNSTAGDHINHQTVYRYPLLSAFLTTTLTIVFTLGMIIANNIKLGGYLIISGISFIMLLCSIYLFIYSIKIDEAYVVIKGFSTKKFLLDKIISINSCENNRNAYTIVTLLDGKKFIIHKELKNYNLLLENLIEYCHIEKNTTTQNNPKAVS